MEPTTVSETQEMLAIALAALTPETLVAARPAFADLARVCAAISRGADPAATFGLESELGQRVIAGAARSDLAAEALARSRRASQGAASIAEQRAQAIHANEIGIAVGHLARGLVLGLVGL